MAQYVSYRENTAPNALQTKKTVGAGAFKRPALAVINTNQPRLFEIKRNPWDDPSCLSTTCTDSLAAAPKFNIFEDDSMQISPCVKEQIPDTPDLPECLTKLYTYSEERKENKPWSLPEPPKSFFEREIREKKWTVPFREDVHGYLKDLETKHRPSASYIRRQPDINPTMRTVLVDWLIEVGEEYQLHEETVHLAVSYTDRFLSKMSVLRGKLQLVGTTCMFIASKHEEIYPPELKDFVYITDNTYTKKQILRMEQLILSILNFELGSPTSFSFLRIYASMTSACEKTIALAQYIAEITLLETEPHLIFLPSQIGASCLALANVVLGLPVWPDYLVAASGYSFDDIRLIVLCLHEKYRAISKCPQQAVCEKYKTAKYENVAFIQCPESIKV